MNMPSEEQALQEYVGDWYIRNIRMIGFGAWYKVVPHLKIRGMLLDSQISMSNTYIRESNEDKT